MSSDRPDNADQPWSTDAPSDDAALAEADVEVEVDEAGAKPIKTPSRRSGGASGVLAAAMIGVGQVIEPEKTHVEIVQLDDRPLDDPDLGFTLDFSDVPVMEPDANDQDSKDDQ